jgi:hypothetical protein
MGELYQSRYDRESEKGEGPETGREMELAKEGLVEEF